MWGSLRTMARKLRVEYPGAVYHVMNRGDRRKRIFRDDADRQRFVHTLGEACELGRRVKGDAGKVAMAARLRAETAVTVKWIAERLQMGAPGYLNHLLYLRRRMVRE